MKHLILSLIIFLLYVNSLNAQTTTDRSVRLSFTINSSFNWMSSGETTISRKKMAAGTDFGINADFFFDTANRYAFATGLLVSSMGGEMTYNTNENFQFAKEEFQSGTSIRYRLHYLEIPTMLKLYTNQFDRWTYWTQFGLSNYINISAKADSNDGQLHRSDIDDEVKLFNMALNVGLGGQYDLGGGNAVIIGLIYNGGFTDITSGKHIPDEKMTLSSMKLKLALLF